MIDQNYSKANFLKKVKEQLSLFKVPELVSYSAAQLKSDKESALEEIARIFQSRLLIIRSSAADEDGQSNSSAGEYDSVLNIPSDNTGKVTEAINTVIASYERKRPLLPEDEVIIQEMVQGSTMSGVVFTHDLNTGAPYYVINYDDVSGLTDTVTSGGGEYSNRTLYIHRGSTPTVRSERFLCLIKAIQELELVVGSQFIDIEFSLGEELTPHLLQVRAITTKPNWNRGVSKRIDATLRGVQRFVRSHFQPVSGVYGPTTVFGQMPDWNPAEMIGRAPRALAFSLYKTLITDHAWRIAREEMGYATPAGQPLMISLAGQPFIDTRLSFHSYLPAGLSPDIGEKLVEAWVERLKTHPELHDKIEFEVAITTYSFDIDDKIEVQIGQVLNQAEKSAFKDALRQQTCELLADSDEGGISSALARVNELAKKQLNMSALPKESNIKAMFGMIEDCVRLGTIPFSILARHGFIARTILLSLNKCGILSEEDVNNIQSSVRTVASDLVDDMYRLQFDKLTRSSFMKKYGHLRPGTYDILSLRYDQMHDLEVKAPENHKQKSSDAFDLSTEKKQAINHAIKSAGFTDMDADMLLRYIQAATAGREYGKFVFTRSVSDLLELIVFFGEEYGLSRDEMSHIPIDNIMGVIVKSSDEGIEERLRQVSAEERERHMVSTAIRLPQVLFDEEGVHVVPFQVSTPNFITHKTIRATCICLLVGDAPPDLKGKIVLIENADPGFDWIFAQQIGGLITKYGGANSHMAIRCAEFGIPAAIGCGEQRFESMRKAHHLLLDCSAGLVKELHQ